jgi:hypothetical protein
MLGGNRMVNDLAWWLFAAAIVVSLCGLAFLLPSIIAELM